VVIGVWGASADQEGFSFVNVPHFLWRDMKHLQMKTGTDHKKTGLGNLFQSGRIQLCIVDYFPV